MANILRYAGFIKESEYGVRAAGDLPRGHSKRHT